MKRIKALAFLLAFIFIVGCTANETEQTVSESSIAENESSFEASSECASSDYVSEQSDESANSSEESSEEESSVPDESDVISNPDESEDNTGESSDTTSNDPSDDPSDDPNNNASGDKDNDAEPETVHDIELLIPPTESVPARQFTLFDPAVFEFDYSPADSETKQALLDELEAIIAKKSYGSEAEDMLRRGFSETIDHYHNFQRTFAFLGAPDVSEYVRTYMLDPLDTMVNTIIYEQSEGDHAGSASDSTKTMFIAKGAANDAIEASILVHELYHMAVAKEHWNVDSSYHFPLNEGGATIMELTLLGSDRFYDLTTLDHTRHGFGNGTAHSIYFGKLGPTNYSLYSSIWFRLFSLTDFKTMENFLYPNGTDAIREELVRRYGKDGGIYFDRLLTFFVSQGHDTAIDAESLYLELLGRRLKEIDSKQEMFSFIELYRMLRSVFGSDYVYQSTVEVMPDCLVSRTNDAIHPRLKYHTLDYLTAMAMLDHGILNTEELSDKEAYALAYSIIAPLWFDDPIEYRDFGGGDVDGSAIHFYQTVCTATYNDKGRICFEFKAVNNDEVYYTPKAYDGKTQRCYITFI